MHEPEKITREKWRRTPTDYKQIRPAVTRWILKWDDQYGTVLAPVTIDKASR